jgi:hypothetical protein
MGYLPVKVKRSKGTMDFDKETVEGKEFGKYGVGERRSEDAKLFEYAKNERGQQPSASAASQRALELGK